MLDVTFELCGRVSVHREAKAFCAEKLASEVRWQSQGQTESLADTLTEPETAGLNSRRSRNTSAQSLFAL